MGTFTATVLLMLACESRSRSEIYGTVGPPKDAALIEDAGGCDKEPFDAHEEVSCCSGMFKELMRAPEDVFPGA